MGGGSSSLRTVRKFFLGPSGSQPTRPSSNPLDISERVIRTLLSIRNLSPSTQEGYSKDLKILAKNTDLNNPEDVENFVLSLDRKSK